MKHGAWSMGVLAEKNKIQTTTSLRTRCGQRPSLCCHGRSVAWPAAPICRRLQCCHLQRCLSRVLRAVSLVWVPSGCWPQSLPSGVVVKNSSSSWQLVERPLKNTEPCRDRKPSSQMR